LVRRREIVCPHCGGALTINGCYRRHYRDECGKRHYGWVAQGHCSVCRKYPSLLPHFLMSHKHYEAVVIERVIKNNDENCPSNCAASDSTMRRWVNQFNERGAQAVGWLISILYAIYERRVSVIELHSKSLLKQLSRIIKEYQAPKNGEVIGMANIILTMYNCGFL